jgi:hypothetical protein
MTVLFHLLARLLRLRDGTVKPGESYAALATCLKQSRVSGEEHEIKYPPFFRCRNSGNWINSSGFDGDRPRRALS